MFYLVVFCQNFQKRVKKLVGACQKCNRNKILKVNQNVNFFTSDTFYTTGVFTHEYAHDPTLLH